LNEFVGAQHLRLFTASSLVRLLAEECFEAVVVDERGRGLRLLARLRAIPSTRVDSTLARPGRLDPWRLRAIYARHALKYLWKSSGRVKVAAAARRVPGAKRLNAWLRRR
jgi:hypothetical protein